MSRDPMEPLTILNAHGDELRLVDIDEANADDIADLGLTGERALLIQLTEGTVAMATIGLDVDGAIQLRDALTEWLDDAIPPLVREFVVANLDALTAMSRVAEHGGKKHGGGMGPGEGQTVGDHLDHCDGHTARTGYRCRTGTDWNSIDPETGELDLAHAATRLVMAIGVLERGGKR